MPGQVEGRMAEHLVETPNLESYMQWVTDYTSRQLSLGTGILKAFNGVAHAMAAGFGSRMLFDLPERILPRCLGWTCNGPFVKRQDSVTRPSWSWA